VFKNKLNGKLTHLFKKRKKNEDVEVGTNAWQDIVYSWLEKLILLK
jgi:hypothetical protein